MFCLEWIVRERVVITPAVATPLLTNGRCLEAPPPNVPAVDLDNDYIEPESPTGTDALIYDDDEDEDEGGNTSSSSVSPHNQPQQSNGSADEDLSILPCPPMVRDDYNPSKPLTDTTPT